MPSRTLSTPSIALSMPPSALDKPGASVGRGGKLICSDGRPTVGRDSGGTLSETSTDNGKPAVGIGRRLLTGSGGRRFVGSERAVGRPPKPLVPPSRFERAESSGTLVGKLPKRLVAPPSNSDTGRDLSNSDTADSRGTFVGSGPSKSDKAD